MDAYYYLMAQVPALVAGAGPAMASADFLLLCRDLLPKSEYKALIALSIDPPKEEGGTGKVRLEKGWYRYERSLRNALAGLRAQRLGREYISTEEDISFEAQTDARAALGAESPLEGEEMLIARRIAFIEAVLGTEWFSREGAAAYLLITKLLERRARFREEEGFNEYKRIYTGIMEGSGYSDQLTSAESGLGE